LSEPRHEDHDTSFDNMEIS
jgi:hypothetical protein